MKGIYANITWYAFMVFGLISAGYKRHTSQEWESMADVRFNYDLLFGSLVIFLVVCIVGLFNRKKWGYKLAVSANATLTILPITALIVTLAVTYQELGFIKILEINTINLLTGFVSLIFWVWLAKSNIRDNFV
jgi:uncharacterized membrane protein